MSRIWTPEQSDAISARGGNVLVSAAAGSGKTAVLVERVIGLLTDEAAPTDADRLLIVTFTRAAAQQMRSRISERLEQKISEQPSNELLKRQRLLLPLAKICTIDSFCLSLVRDNFQLLDISPDACVGEEGRLSLISHKAMEQTLEQLYAEGDESFLTLVELLFKGRDDSGLSEAVEALYYESMSYPFPERWLDGLLQSYNADLPVGQSIFGKTALSYAEDALCHCCEIYSRMQQIADQDEQLAQSYDPAIKSDLDGVHAALERVRAGDYEGARQAIYSFKAVARKRLSSQAAKSEQAALLSSLREQAKKLISKKLTELFCCTEREYRADMRFLFPPVKSLIDAVKKYSARLRELKLEQQVLEFSDITHLALRLLVECDGDGNVQSTALARETAQDIDEILIDEYQDTNLAQDMVLQAVSRKNLFKVGDVKQSIYSFRRAMPDIFIALSKASAPYVRGAAAENSKIFLKNNFRSRAGVTGAVNFLFSQIMSPKVGDIDYNESERLVFSADYPQLKDECAELHVLQCASDDEQTADEQQAQYIAGLIKKMIDEGFCVSDKNGLRRAAYGDFCVLLRNVKGRAAVYAAQFRKSGVDCYAETSVSFFSANEVSLMLNLLRVIDNPRQDVALLSVMLSPLYGFTADEIAKFRIKSRDTDLYMCVVQAAADGSRRAKGLLSDLESYRMQAVCMGTQDFIRAVYEKTAVTALVSAMPEPTVKRTNLLLLLQYAAEYESSEGGSLSGFIGFIDRLIRLKKDLPGSIGASDRADVVRIMSIHKSKGLEFPVCIVANCAGRFNFNDEKSGLVISAKHGIGLTVRDSETMAQYSTLCHRAIKQRIRSNTLSEEMRILYVAMTRAREKLIMVVGAGDCEKRLLAAAQQINPQSGRSDAFSCSLASSYADWLLPAFMRHEDARELRQFAGAGEDIVIKSDFRLKAVLCPAKAENTAEKERQTEEKSVSEELYRQLKSRVEWEYPYRELSYAVGKRAASQVDKGFVDREYFASQAPAFACEKGLTAAQRGTATHAFMQFADYTLAAGGVEAEISRLCERGFLTQAQAQAINVAAVQRFFKSSLCQRILNSPLVMREKKFTMFVPAGEIYPELMKFPDEQVVIQGIADCAFLEGDRLVVVDYKTDRVSSSEELTAKYRSQISLYKRALETCTPYKVKAMLLYSFSLGTEIEVGE